MRVGRTYRYISRRKGEEAVGAEFMGKWGATVAAALLALVSLVFFFSEKRYHDAEVAFATLEPVDVTTSDMTMLSLYEGQLVHFSSSNLHILNTVEDPEFGITFPGSFQAKRHTEYCQWVETSSTTTEKDRDGNEVKTTTYYYTKSWVYRPINSYLFDQPFAHFNPQDDPFPTITLPHPAVVVSGKFHLPAPLVAKIRGPESDVLWARDQLQGFQISLAAKMSFAYIPSTGYFLSRYNAGTNWMQYAGMFLEGTLLDFQLGDFLGACTPGDIRVRYTTFAPDSVSVIGKMLGPVPGGPEAVHGIGQWITENGVDATLLHTGILTADEMLTAELNSLWWQATLVHAVAALVWGPAVAWVLFSTGLLEGSGIWWWIVGAGVGLSFGIYALVFLLTGQIMSCLLQLLCAVVLVVLFNTVDKSLNGVVSPSVKPPEASQ
ncbi:Transmembrane protein 43-like [Pelomyxa schiedti]|nr:Transmembrane protein 43-like [Pelomyxa schiedti]